jgi:outer membrane biosynthesis protein TonB
VAPGLSFWQFALRALTVVVALVSTAAIAYFLLSERSPPFAQLQEQPQPQAVEEVEQKALAPQRQAQAEQPQEPEPEAEQAPAQQPVPSDLGPRLAMPTDDKLIMLINSSLIALNQANATGNYSVLREMAAPGFQQANSAAKLSQAFKELRSRNLDLTPVLLFQPKLYQRPAMSDKGMIRVTGYFPTSPERVNFDLIFQPVHGKWRLYGIAANTQRVQPNQAAPQPQGAPGSAVAPQPEAAEVVKPGAPVKKPAAKPKPAAAEIEETAPPDVRDRIDTPPPAPPPSEKPKQKSGWNPFGR